MNTEVSVQTTSTSNSEYDLLLKELKLTTDQQLIDIISGTDRNLKWHALSLLHKLVKDKQYHSLLDKKGILDTLIDSLEPFISAAPEEIPFHGKALLVLATIASDEELLDQLSRSNLIRYAINVVLNSPKGNVRKQAARILYHISESKWTRDEIPKVLRKFYNEAEQKKFIEGIIAEPLDEQDIEIWEEMTKNTDLVLHQYKPGKAWYDPATFPITKLLEDNWKIIKEEAIAAITPENTLPWPEKFLYKKGWEVLGFYAFKNKIEVNCQRCPKTAAILDQIPGVTTALFSCLQPRCHIKPHVGYYQYSEKILRVHLGIIVPKGCTLRVNGEGREWEEGKVLIFDDTFRHEAWNPSHDATRVVFMLDIDFVGNVSDRNPEFYAKSKRQEELGSDALVSKDLMQVLQSVGASMNNLQERPQKYL